MIQKAPLCALVAELVGTFALVFVGCGAVVLDHALEGALGVLGIAVAFGAVVTAMIFAFGPVSGAHINPAVTLGFFAARRFPAAHVLPYVVAQCLGAIAAGAVLSLLAADPSHLGATVPAGTVTEGFLIELGLTFGLMLVIQVVSARGSLPLTAILVGGYVGAAAFFGGPFTGASMNPARSLGPAVFAGQLPILWLYFLAPALGAVATIPFCSLMKVPGCCGRAASEATAT